LKNGTKEPSSRGIAGVRRQERVLGVLSRVVVSMGEALREDPRGPKAVIKSWQAQRVVNQQRQNALTPAPSEGH